VKFKAIKDTSSTSSVELSTALDEGAATGPVEDFGPLPVYRPGRFLASIVFGATLAVGGTETQSWWRRRQDVVAESSTAAVEVTPFLLQEVRELFEQGASEFFRDGMHSNFSRRLLALLARHGQAAFRAIETYLFTSSPKPDVVSESLRWLADFNDAATLPQRWNILQRTLKNPSPRVRDGAILGFAALDDPRAQPVLMEARNVEQISALRSLIDQVIAQLQRPR
jgi:hypothetical protein